MVITSRSQCCTSTGPSPRGRARVQRQAKAGLQGGIHERAGGRRRDDTGRCAGHLAACAVRRADGPLRRPCCPQTDWSWLAAGLSGLATIIPHLFTNPGFVTFELWPLTLPTLLVPVLGWWNWNRLNNRHIPEGLPVRHAAGKDYLIGGIVLVIPGLISITGLLSQAALPGVNVGQLALAVVGLFMPGIFLLALLGLAFGVMESWWLLLLHSAWYLVPAVLDLNTVAPPGFSVAAYTATAVLHAGIIIAAVLGYRNWNSHVSASQSVPRL